MDKPAKDAIHDLVLKLRETLEAEVERELGRYGIYVEREWIDAGNLPRLTDKERNEDRPRIEAAIRREQDAGLKRPDAVQAFIRETAYTHMNRLLGLKCMEVRDLIDETITTRSIYSDRSKRHRDHLDEHPRAHREPDRGLVVMLQEAYAEVSQHIGVVFDPDSDYSIVWPRHTVLKQCIDWINAVDAEVARVREADPDSMPSVYTDDTALGWVYQYFQEEEKDRVFREVRTKKKKISGYDIVPATTIYTEHYMVQFLVENSLGALWMEMYPDSDLCESWEYWVEDPNLQNEDGTRQRGRDPKPVPELTLLDPACGSGHFLLYAFDLFAQMYVAEAKMEGRPADRAEIARRILRDNLYGIDIDLRSIQLSALNLYMKACTYAGVRLDGLQNGGSVQMNLVCADIVLRRGPELQELLDRFKTDPLTQDLVKTIWHSLENARELGSLLKVEKQVDEVITRKRRAEEGTFWEHPEELWERWKQDFLNALKDYVDRAAESFDVNRRMFGQEMLRGMQLLDLLTRRFDVITTNPPYAGYTGLGGVLKDYIEHHYQEGKVDLYTAFIIRCMEFACRGGKWGMVCQQSFMFLPSFSDLRKKLLSEVQIETLAHLGPHAFEDIGGEKVNTVLLVCERGRGNVVNPGLYFNLRDTSDKISSLLSVVKLDGRDPNTYQVSQDAFLGVEGAPFQYWTSSRVLELLQECPPLKAFCDVKTGMRLSRKHIWTRLHWEVPSGQNSPRWVPYARGGEVRKWYGNLEWLLDWSERAQQEYGKKKYHRNQDYYFRRGLTWTDITSREFSLRYLPEGCVFDVGGPSLFPKELDFWYVLAFLNTRLVNYILNKLNATFHYYVSDVERVPVCLPDVETQEICANLARLATEIQTEIVEHELDQPDFQITLLEKFSNQPSRNPTLESAFSCVTHFSEDKLLSLIIIGDCIEKLICQLYQLHDRDRATIFREQGVPPTLHPILVDHELIPHGLEPEIYDYLESLPRVELAPKELAALQEKLKQLYVDEDNSIRKVSTVLEINPVSVVALCREMGLVNPKNLRHAVEDFLTHHIWELCKRDEDGIIPYDAGLRNASLLEQVRGEIEAVFSAERAVDIEAELDEILGRGGLAGWLENPFFKKHTSQFKKRPILWQIVSPNHQFRALVYYHKLDADTLPKIRSQYLWPLLERARTQLRAAREQDPPDMKTIGDLEDYIADLEACDTALESVIQGVVLSLSKGTVDVNLPDWANGPYRNGQAPYHPDLDDGVKVNILPLQAAGLLPVKKVV